MMEINRNNYEEFFLLYVDNELSDAERKGVESFLIQNADLEPELAIWKQTKMKPEKGVFFEHKEVLLRQGDSSEWIHPMNYRELFLLYTDGELSTEDMKKVEAFAALHPFYQNELSSFLQTRIQPEDELVFEGKEILFRTGNRVRLWPRISVAAASLLILFAGYYAFHLSQTKPGRLSGVSTAIHAPAPNIKNREMIKKDQGTVTPLTVQPLYISDRPKNRPSMENLNPKTILQPERKTPRRTPTPNVDDPGVELVKASRPGIEMVPSGPISIQSVNRDTALLADQKPGLEFMTSPEDGNAMAISSESKNKMRGLIRKVSRVFGKTTSAGQEKGKQGILIGGFQIALK
jgi:hypothetical protein